MFTYFNPLLTKIKKFLSFSFLQSFTAELKGVQK